jgi:hypothetical protein
LREVEGVGTFDQMQGKTVELNLGEFTCRVLDINALIAAKTAAGRDKDRTAGRHLEATKEARGL